LCKKTKANNNGNIENKYQNKLLLLCVKDKNGYNFKKYALLSLQNHRREYKGSYRFVLRYSPVVEQLKTDEVSSQDGRENGSNILMESVNQPTAPLNNGKRVDTAQSVSNTFYGYVHSHVSIRFLFIIYFTRRTIFGKI